MSNYNDCYLPYNAPVPYNGITTPDCGYNNCISYNTAMLYNECATPPIPPTPINRGGGGFVPSEYYPQIRRPDDDEAIALIFAEFLSDE